MADNNIIFIGMPAVGKSTVGVVIAKRLGYKFVDTDILIQESEGKLLKDIIADVGPDGFLKVEDRVNAQVKAERTVISPGGSVVYCENAMKHYKEIGKVVYLQASFETINSRLKNAKGRGVVLRDGQTLKDLYDERVKLFEKYADITVCEDNQKLEDTIEKTLDAPQRAAANAALCRRVLELDAYRTAHTLLLYAAFGGEADLAAVAAEAVRQGKTVAYPVCGEGFALTAAVPSADGWAVGQYGIRTPCRNRLAL